MKNLRILAVCIATLGLSQLTFAQSNLSKPEKKTTPATEIKKDKAPVAEGEKTTKKLETKENVKADDQKGRKDAERRRFEKKEMPPKGGKKGLKNEGKKNGTKYKGPKGGQKPEKMKKKEAAVEQ